MNYLDMNPEIVDRMEKHPFVFSRFILSKRNVLLVCLGVLAVSALIDFFVLGLARRTFVFYAIENGAEVVEERMLKVSKGNPTSQGLSVGKPVSRGIPKGTPSPREADITRYVEEALLGPVSPNSLPLFPKETRLRSLLYRNGVVYADLSEDAAMPPIEGVPLTGTFIQGGDVFTNMETLYAGVRRNFPFVREMRFFIAGEAAYPGKFR